MSLSQLCARIHRRRVGTFASGRRASPRGQALVEFALALPLFLILVFGILDLGRMIAMHSAAVTASREGARYGAAVGDGGVEPYLDCNGIRQAARAGTAPLVALDDPNQIEITYVDAAESQVTQACPPLGTGPVKAEIDPLDRIMVKVTLQYEPITPVIQAMIGPIDVVSIDRRTIAKAGP